MAEPRKQNIERLRTRQGLSRQGLADQLGISYNHLWGIERGKHDASTDLLCRIAIALDADIDDVMVRAKKAEPERRANPTTHPQPSTPVPPPRPTRRPSRDTGRVAS